MFKKQGFLIERKILDVNKWYEEVKSKESECSTDDPQCPGNKSMYNGLNELQDIIKPIIENITNLELYKTYNYFRIYTKNAYLNSHTDRDACEISVTLNLGGDDWSIGIFDYDDNPHTILLTPGDALIYHGCDLVHWRPGKFNGNELVQVFIHFVDKNGNRSWAKDDIIRESLNTKTLL